MLLRALFPIDNYLDPCTGIVANDSYSYVAYGNFNLNMFFENLIVLSNSDSLSISFKGISLLKYFLALFETIPISSI